MIRRDRVGVGRLSIVQVNTHNPSGYTGHTSTVFCGGLGAHYIKESVH